MRMLASTVELLVGLFLDAVILLIAFCIVGSIAAALRAVSRGSDHQKSYQNVPTDLKARQLAIYGLSLGTFALLAMLARIVLRWTS